MTLVLSETARRRVQLNFPIDTEIHSALARRASDLERSVSGHVRMLIREDLARSMNDNGPAAFDAPGATTDVHQEDDSAQQR